MAEEKDAPPRAGGRARYLAIAAVVLALAIAGFLWLRSGRESTDDAQIDGHITQIATRVGGTVIAVHVNDNQVVEAGTVLATYLS